MRSESLVAEYGFQVEFRGRALHLEENLEMVKTFELGDKIVSSELPPEFPHMQKKGSATQLLVDGKPFVMLGGQLHNSSASGVDYMRSLWPRLRALGLNTVEAPVSWELFEPEEGHFDLTFVDELLALARKHEQRLVLLWFGSWKNGVSSYAPGWVLKDTARFPRAKGADSQNKDVLSTLSSNNLKADAAAFAVLMRHLKQADGKQHTVVLVQVENEVGIMPEIRDLCIEGNVAFGAAVPPQLLEYLGKHKESLHPELLQRWNKSGCAAQGSWGEVFGGGPEADEVFSVWHYASYIDQVAAAGQAEYPLPMYCNAWLPGKLGTYPSGGPVAHMHDIWRAAAPHIVLLAPDIYAPQFKEMCAAYARGGNPFFVPEASKDDLAAARAYWAIAQHHALGFAPFGIESIREDHPLVDAFRILRQLLPAITEAHGSARMIGVYRQGNEESPAGPLDVGDYRVRITYEAQLPEKHFPVGGLVIQTGAEEFIIAGYGFCCRFEAQSPGPRSTRILSVELGSFGESGRWVHEIWLNGDETGANNYAHIPPLQPNEFLGINRPMILRVKLYRHD